MRTVCSSCGVEQVVEKEEGIVINHPNPDDKVYNGFRILARIETPLGNYRIGVKGCPDAEGLESCGKNIDDFAGVIRRTIMKLCEEMMEVK